jgi:F420-dependent oxidoreductase-like protein
MSRPNSAKGDLVAKIIDGQIRFGIHSGPQHTTYPDYLTLWQTVEKLGYDWASVFDHFIPIYSDPLGPCFEGPTLLAALAASTSRIRCGILVVGNTYRHPAVQANIAATIDHISGGRLEWGLGAGWWEMEHEEYHIPYYTPARRIRMMGESARVQRLLWTEPRATYEGRYYQVTDALNEPKPLQDPLPLWIGGAGEQLTLRIVAESADGWNTFFMPAGAYQHKLDVLAQHCRDVGRDPGDIRKSLVIRVALAPTEAEARERVDRMARAADTSAEALTQRLVAGTPEQVAERLIPYLDLGVGDFLISARAPFDYDTIRGFIEQVAPAVREAAKQRAR